MSNGDTAQRIEICVLWDSLSFVVIYECENNILKTKFIIALQLYIQVVVNIVHSKVTKSRWSSKTIKLPLWINCESHSSCEDRVTK